MSVSSVCSSQTKPPRKREPHPIPASGAWTPGDVPGDRLFAQLGPVRLEAGAVLPDVTIAYESWGELAPDRSNAVLVLHALTGDSHVRGPTGPGHPSPGWWESLVGPGAAIDTRHWFVIAPNVLGGCQGSTGPASPAPDGHPWGSRFPALTVRDQVQAERRLAKHLRIERFAMVIGGSMGGMRAVEWAVTDPEAVERLAVIAGSARASADQIAWNSAQIAAIEADPAFHHGDYHHLPAGHGPHRGLGIARRIAHTTYRTAEELQHRFGNRPQEPSARQGDDAGAERGQIREADRRRGGDGSVSAAPGATRHQVTSYLDHHADKLARRFDAASYRSLVQAMNGHDVGRGRGGVAAALSRVRARTLVVGIDSDRLFPPALVREIAEGIPDAQWREMRSPIGHDAFLLPHEDLQRWIRGILPG